MLYILLLIPLSATENCNPKKTLQFTKIRTCFKSTLPIMSWKTANSSRDCADFAKSRSAFAYNFSPSGMTLKNCQILGCPELTNSSTFIFDPNFDYYTAYGNFETTVNASCARTIGLFSLIPHKMNYSDAINHCQSLGADLADVMSEARTNFLSSLVKSLKKWYKVAYVGLDDLNTEGFFENALGMSLHCNKYRAWAVGHPRPNHQKEDCVILDDKKTWRAINCKIKLPFICEFYPSLPNSTIINFEEKNCSFINNKKKLKECEDFNDLYKIYQNSSRIDQCALSNNFD